MAVVSMKALLETGVHFGHRTRKWNPRMKPYIFTERNGIHIIDLQQTLESLQDVYALVRDVVADGGDILFVGTKRQAQETIEVEASRCDMPYVNWRWLGGTLTNWRTIRSRIDELKGLEERRDAGEFELLTKKEALMLTRRIAKLEQRLGGIRDMDQLPKLLYVVDVRREDTAVHEANLLDIPVIGLVDTNCDPYQVDYVIPSNDDAIRAIKLLSSAIADAVLEGREMRKDDEVQEPSGEQTAVENLDMTDEELLGEATLAKLQSGEYDERKAEEEAAAKAPKADEATEESEAAAEEEAPKADEATEEIEAAAKEEASEADEATEEGEAAAEEEASEADEATEEDEPEEAEAEESKE